MLDDDVPRADIDHLVPMTGLRTFHRHPLPGPGPLQTPLGSHDVPADGQLAQANDLVYQQSAFPDKFAESRGPGPESGSGFRGTVPRSLISDPVAVDTFSPADLRSHGRACVSD